jgi:hypothetical protein
MTSGEGDTLCGYWSSVEMSNGMDRWRRILMYNKTITIEKKKKKKTTEKEKEEEE